MPGLQARTASLQASERGAELAEVLSCGAVASSLAGFKGKCPLPSGSPSPELGAVGQMAPGRFSVPVGVALRESETMQREGHHHRGSVRTARQRPLNQGKCGYTLIPATVLPK